MHNMETLPPVGAPRTQKRSLRDDELPTIVHVSGTSVPLRIGLETVHKAMQGNTGKTLTAPDFYSGKPVHVRADAIDLALKAVEQPTQLGRKLPPPAFR
jgi:hypothetical protein